MLSVCALFLDIHQKFVHLLDGTEPEIRQFDDSSTDYNELESMFFFLAAAALAVIRISSMLSFFNISLDYF